MRPMNRFDRPPLELAPADDPAGGVFQIADCTHRGRPSSCRTRSCRFHLVGGMHCALLVAGAVEDGLTQEAIARLLGVSRDTVKQLEARAIEKLLARARWRSELW